MPSANLLALLDDVAALTKLAATKTAPVLGDDSCRQRRATIGWDQTRSGACSGMEGV